VEGEERFLEVGGGVGGGGGGGCPTRVKERMEACRHLLKLKESTRAEGSGGMIQLPYEEGYTTCLGALGTDFGGPGFAGEKREVQL